MKVGDLVRFTKEHSSRPGFDYCASWKGIIFQDPNDLPGMYKICWTTQHGTHIGVWSDYDAFEGYAFEGLEVLSESR